MKEETKLKIKTNWNEFKNQAIQCTKEALNKETRKKQIPNMFTASRLLAPFFIIPAALTGNIILTGIFTSMFALTDAADGYFARKYDATSEFGRKLDPITDKIFAGSLLFPLVFYNPITIINLLGELVIALINTRSELNNNTPHTIFIGKIKTASLYLAIVLNYLTIALGLNPAIINFLNITTALLQTSTACKYYKIDNKQKQENFTKNENNNVMEEIENNNEKKNTISNKHILNPTSIEEQITALENLKQELKDEYNNIETEIQSKVLKIQKK